MSLLPEGEPWYDKDFFTDRNLRFFASEIIREKILTNYDKEIPYCTEVVIEEFKENADRYDIRAVINVMRDSQKGIIIGARGSSLKRVGTQARIDMEDFFQKKVFLQLYVKVDPHWRDDKRKLCGVRVLAYSFGRSRARLLSGCFCSPSEGGLLSGHFHSPSEGGISSVCLRMPSELL